MSRFYGSKSLLRHRATADAVKLREFAAGSTLEFSIDLKDRPEKMFELKVNAMSLEMVGATSAQSANIWITHSGQWSMKQRTGEGTFDFLLLPRSELFACSPGGSPLKARIPANPQPSAEPGECRINCDHCEALTKASS